MEAPSSFVDLLHRTFDGRLRIRWSVASRRWLIEQKVGHGFAVSPIQIDETRDDLIRARDGYHPVMEITLGDRIQCPQCHLELRVPVFETHDIRCGYCALKGRQTRIVAGYWPLNERLIEHLRKIDPLRDQQSELAAEADRRNRLLLKSQEDAAMAPGLAYADEAYNRLVGIPQVGYTGKTLNGPDTIRS